MMTLDAIADRIADATPNSPTPLFPSSPAPSVVPASWGVSINACINRYGSRADFVAIIRDAAGNGVRADRVDEWCLTHPGVRVFLASGGTVDLKGITREEFAKRLDRALTAQMETDQ